MNTLLKKYFSHKGTSKLTKAEFVLLHTLTLGTYGIYWAWAAWETARISAKKNYSFKSSLRAVALPVSSFWLFHKLSKITKSSYPPLLLTAVALFALLVASTTIPTNYQYGLKGLVTFMVLGAIEAILLLPAYETQRKAVGKVKSPKGNNTPLVWVLFVAFAITLVSIFVKP